MRTTQKRRSFGSANGNGASPPAPPIPPEPPQARPVTPPSGAPSPRSSYRVRRNPLRVLGKVVMWLIVVVLVAVGALAGGVKLYFDYSVAAIRPHSKEVIAAQEILEAPTAGQPATAIVIGYDKRAGEIEAGSRSDTVMLVRIDPKKDVVSMLSFPRDLIVDIPGCSGHPSWSGRINEAYAYCGPRGTLATVKQLTGVPVNYMITVNFKAFQRIVDKLGGVYMDVDHRYFNDNSTLAAGSTFATIDLKPGYQHLDGSEALDFVRFRHTDSDLLRVVRQQEFVKAFKQQVSDAWSLFQLPGVVKAITENVEVAKGGKKALDPDEVISYARALYSLPAGGFQQVPLENVSGYNELAVSEADLQDAVQRFENPDVRAPEKAITVATGGKPKEEGGPPPSQVTVEVVNGNGVAGAADDAAYRLAQIGYKAANGGNADNFDYFHTTVYYDPAVTDADLAAKRIGDLFGDADVEPVPASEKLQSMLKVVVGKTFQGSLSPAPRDTTPERQKPTVVGDDTIASLLRPLKKQTRFTIMTPTVKDSTSTLSTLEGVRAYRLADHRALRITYETGNEYWGIQETNWTEPPLLEGPTLERTIKGRPYKLYFSGSKLHIVAFEQDGTVYWVVNTLLNKLSNETMIAIAEGLEPLGRS
jgi:LCP family protein required for cell wall assembly